METDSIKITDHEIFQTIDQTTIDQFTITITIDHVTIPKIETQIVKIEKEIFLNHRLELKHNIKQKLRPQKYTSTT